MVKENTHQSKNILKRFYSWTSRKIQNAYSFIKNKWSTTKDLKQTNPIDRHSYRRYVKEKLRKRRGKQYRFTLQKKFKSFLYRSAKSHQHNDLSCPICIQYLTIPTSTPCGHTFCFKCIDQVLLFNSQCPVCRESIRTMDPTPCNMLQNILIKRAQYSMNETAFKIYRQRVQQETKWRQQRYPNTHKLSIGDQIDVRDTQFIWCSANIVQIYKNQDKITGVLVHYRGWNRIYDQIIDIKSSRLASAGFFTGRKDIARYNLSQMDNNMRGAVTYGQPEQIADSAINAQLNRNRSVSDYLLNSLAFVLEGNSNRISYIGDPNPFELRLQNSNGGERSLNFEFRNFPLRNTNGLEFLEVENSDENEQLVQLPQEQAIENPNQQSANVPLEYSLNSMQLGQQNNAQRQHDSALNLNIQGASFSEILFSDIIDQQDLVVQISDDSEIEQSDVSAENVVQVNSENNININRQNLSQNDHSL